MQHLAAHCSLSGWVKCGEQLSHAYGWQTDRHNTLLITFWRLPGKLKIGCDNSFGVYSFKPLKHLTFWATICSPMWLTANFCWKTSSLWVFLTFLMTHLFPNLNIQADCLSPGRATLPDFLLKSLDVADLFRSLLFCFWTRFFWSRQFWPQLVLAPDFASQFPVIHSVCYFLFFEFQKAQT